MVARVVPWVSPDEYLKLEAQAETKHIYFDGVITAMAGGTVAHGILAMNFGSELRSGLRGRGCKTVGSDVLLQTGRKEMYVYPDVMVICGPVATMENRPSVVTNPVFVAEVLSPSTEGEDRGVKALEYRATPSIRQFAFVSQERPWVEIHTRGEDGKWWVEDTVGLDAACVFSALGCTVPMAALYEGVLDG